MRTGGRRQLGKLLVLLVRWSIRRLLRWCVSGGLARSAAQPRPGQHPEQWCRRSRRPRWSRPWSPQIPFVWAVRLVCWRCCSLVGWLFLAAVDVLVSVAAKCQKRWKMKPSAFDVVLPQTWQTRQTLVALLATLCINFSLACVRGRRPAGG